MGYNTRYDLDVLGPRELMDEFIEAAEDESNTFGEYGQPLSDWTYGEAFGGEAVKWYGWQKDTEELSSKFPNLLFTIKGEGEEAGDIWKAWFRNGKSIVKRAKIVFDEPDLHRELPTPDVEKAIAAAKAKRKAELDRQIAELEAAKAAL